MSLDEVPDPVFSGRMMGEGVAIIPKDGTICAPVHGQVIQIAPTKHAIGIAAQDGTEILIHVGLETVSLKGEGFKVQVSKGDVVSVGQPLLTYDLEYIRAHAKSTITPIVVTNISDGNRKIEMTKEKEGIVGKTVIITVLTDKK